MDQNALFSKLERGLRFLAVLAVALIVFQGIGIATYLVRQWPQMRSGIETGIAVVGMLAVSAGLIRSGLWIRIYWNGAKVLSVLRTHGESNELSDRLKTVLRTLTRLLVVSSLLDVLLLPAIFLMDVFFPFKVSSVHLGLVQLAIVLLPQAFGLAALILAYLTHAWGQLLHERCQLKEELELTV